MHITTFGCLMPICVMYFPCSFSQFAVLFNFSTALQGDHVTFLNVYKGFLKSGKSSQWCHKNYVNYHAMVSNIYWMSGFSLNLAWIVKFIISELSLRYYHLGNFVIYIFLLSLIFMIFLTIAEKSYWNQRTTQKNSTEIRHCLKIMWNRYAGKFLHAFIVHCCAYILLVTHLKLPYPCYYLTLRRYIWVTRVLFLSEILNDL